MYYSDSICVCRFSVAKRWQLVVLWPFLLATNSTFRAEFIGALTSTFRAATSSKGKLLHQDDNRS
jgi:hypothetical protein